MAIPGRYRILNHTSLTEAGSNAYFDNNMLAFIDGSLHIKDDGEIKPCQTMFGSYPFTDMATSTKVLYVDYTEGKFYRWNGTSYDLIPIATNSDVITNNSNVEGATVSDAIDNISDQLVGISDFNNLAINFYNEDGSNYQLMLDSSSSYDGVYKVPLMDLNRVIPIAEQVDQQLLIYRNGNTIRSFNPPEDTLKATYMATFMLNGIDISLAESTDSLEIGIMRWNGADSYDQSTVEEIYASKKISFSNTDSNTTTAIFTMDDKVDELTPIIPFIKFPLEYGDSSSLTFTSCYFTIHKIF